MWAVTPAPGCWLVTTRLMMLLVGNPNLNWPTIWARALAASAACFCIVHICRHIMEHGVDPFVQPCFLDLSQCVSRTPLGLGFVPCLTPKGKIWATHLYRFLSGEECALLMGLRAHEIPKVSGVFLKDLVGNSFCLPILVGLWLGILTKVTI